MGATEYDSEVHGTMKTCRICLECSPIEPATPSKLSNSFLYSYSLRDEQLVSPCGCTGTQAYVHLRCLRKWQMAAMSSRYSNSPCNPARICSVCTQRFTISPPRKAFSLRMVSLFDSYAREMAGIALLLCTFYLALSYKFNMHPYILQANEIIQGMAQKHVTTERVVDVEDRLTPGVILIASPSMPSSSSMFSKSVVLLWDHNPVEGTQGVILNKNMHFQEKERLSSSTENLPRALLDGVDSGWLHAGWGGPVSRPHWLLLQMCPKCANKTVHSQCECACFANAMDVCENQWAQIIVPGMLLCRHRTGNSPFIARPPCTATGLESGSESVSASESGSESVSASDMNASSSRENGRGLSHSGKASSVSQEVQKDEKSRASRSRLGGSSSGRKEVGNGDRDKKNGGFLLQGREEKASSSSEEEEEKDSSSSASQFLLLGRAGWRAGQLAAEIRAGWWTIHPQGAKSILSYSLPLSWDAIFLAA